MAPRLGQEIRVGLAFRRIAARLSDESIDDLIELARVNGVVPLLQETASFNWHRKAAIALLGHPAFRKIASQVLDPRPWSHLTRPHSDLTEHLAIDSAQHEPTRPCSVAAIDPQALVDGAEAHGVLPLVAARLLPRSGSAPAS